MNEVDEEAIELASKKRQRSQIKDEDLIDLSEDDEPSDLVEKMEVDEEKPETTSTTPKPKVKRAGTTNKKPKLAESIPPSKRAQHPTQAHELLEADAVKMREDLLRWYDEHQRQMPWRRPSEAYIAKFGSKLQAGEYYDPETSKFDQAYGALVSELMLQQTQVSTVRAYFTKWMKAFPTVEALASASLDEVNAVWAGLGYYRRAKLLHECAKAIVERGGEIPKTAAELLNLPGLGRYTAGAIASVVFSEVTPIVDGNVVRVMTRFRAIGADAKTPIVQKQLWTLAQQAVDPVRPGDFNQALMELGAILCTKSNPSCDSCPVSTQCMALAEVKNQARKSQKSLTTTSSSNASSSSSTTQNNDKGHSETDIEDLCAICTDLTPTTAVTKYPVKGAKKAKKKMTSYVTVLRHRTKEQGEDALMYLVKKRPEGGLLAGFWEFPTVDLPIVQTEEPDDDDDEEDETEKKRIVKGATPAAALPEIDKEVVNTNLKSTFDIDLTAALSAGSSVERKSIGSYEHKFTHIDQTVLIEKIDLVGDFQPEIQDSNAKWVSRTELSSMAISKVTTVCLERAEQKGPLSPKGGSKAKKSAAPVKGQRSITSMFAKSPVKK